MSLVQINGGYYDTVKIQYKVTIYVNHVVTDEFYFNTYARAEQWCNNNEIDGMECYISKVTLPEGD